MGKSKPRHLLGIPIVLYFSFVNFKSTRITEIGLSALARFSSASRQASYLLLSHVKRVFWDSRSWHRWGEKAAIAWIVAS